jgi:ATP synthase protein I
MSKISETKNATCLSAFSWKIKAKTARRRLKAQGKSASTVWLGMGVMWLAGWSVVVPTLLGAAFGIWLDTHHSGKYPWTLMLLILGLGIGCLTAWHWVAKGKRKMREDQEDNKKLNY